MIKEKNYLIHPSYLLLGLVILGISSLFLGFSFAYLYNRVESGIPPVKLPSLFYANSLILITTSLVLHWTKKQYLVDATRNYKIGLSFALFLSLFFLLAQILAYKQLIDSEVLLTQDNMASYLYVISALHLFHVVAGLPFLIHFLFTAIVKMKSPVSVLIYFSDISKKRRLNLLLSYWHYLDALWIYLILFFALNLYI